MDRHPRIDRARVLVMDGLLLPSECADIRARAAAQGFSPARLIGEGRSNEETFIIDPLLADAILIRLRALAPVTAIDDLFEIYRYGAGQHIRLHTDSGRRIRGQCVSNATLLVYLNDGVEGGRTLFPSEGEAVTPMMARAVMFSHRLEHAAEAVLSGHKYVARTSVECQWT
jgi:hypothetical protein